MELSIEQEDLLSWNNVKKIGGGCPTGEARITTAGNMPSKYVIHTVGPVYKDGGAKGEAELLYNSIL